MPNFTLINQSFFNCLQILVYVVANLSGIPNNWKRNKARIYSHIFNYYPF